MADLKREVALQSRGIAVGNIGQRTTAVERWQGSAASEVADGAWTLTAIPL